MFCLLGSDAEQHFDVAAQMSYRAQLSQARMVPKQANIQKARVGFQPPLTHRKCFI
jgi:hypothetical protein